MKKGFTLIETLFVCAIFGIIIVAIYFFISKELISLKKGGKNVEAQRIAREVLQGRLSGKMACPGIIPEFKILYLIRDAGTYNITFVNNDTNGNNEVTADDENITYILNTTEGKTKLIRADDSGSVVITDKLLFDPPVYGFELSYYDAVGSKTTNIALIKTIEVKVQVDTDGDKNVDAELIGCIQPRNL